MPSTNRRIHLAVVSILLGLMLIGLAPAFGQGFEDKVAKDQRQEIKPGEVPPDFTAVDLEGNSFTLSEMAGEKPVVLDFWATWCGPCRMEIPLLNEFSQAHEDEVVVVGISSEDAESEQTVRDFVSEQELTFRIIHDPSRAIIDSYLVTGIPHVVVIDTDGKVVSVHVGYDPEIESVLEEELGL